MSFSPSDVLVAVPTYNEAENIVELLSGVRTALPQARIIVIDDNSSDGTGDLVLGFARGDDRVSLVSRPKKLGVGSAHKCAFREAVEAGAEILVTLDADLTHNPGDLPRLLSALENAQVAVGSRFLPEGGLENWPFNRRFLTHFGHLATRLVLRVPFDSTGALRAYRLGSVKTILDLIPLNDGYSWFYESLAALHHCGVKIVEVPIVLTARTYGSSKMRISDIGFGALNMFRFRISLGRRIREMA